MGTGPRKFGASLRTFVFCDFYVKSSSGYSLVHILPTSSFKNAPNMPEVQTKLLLKSGAHFANLIFQKCSERFSFFTSWNANWALATILCAFLSTTFADREPHPRKQRPYFGDPRSHITRKNTGLLCGHIMTRLPLDVRPKLGNVWTYLPLGRKGKTCRSLKLKSLQTWVKVKASE